MRIPWQRRKPDAGERADPDEAAKRLAQAKAQRSVVDSLVDDLRRIRAHNHFAQQVEATMRRRPR